MSSWMLTYILRSFSMWVVFAVPLLIEGIFNLDALLYLFFCIMIVLF